MPLQSVPTLKYAMLTDVLRKRIRAGEWRPGAQIPPQSVLMKDCSASYATVARALADLRNEGLIESYRGKGTFVSELKHTGVNVAVTFDSAYEVTHPWVNSLLRGVGTSVSDNGWQFQIFPLCGSLGNDAKSGENIFTKMVKSKLINGVISNSVLKYEDLRWLSSARIPIVSVYNEYPGTNIGAVLPDVDGDMDQILDCLMQLGHRKIRIVGGSKCEKSSVVIRASAQFVDAGIKAFKKRNLPLNEDTIIYSDYNWGITAPVLKQCLSSEDRPTALILCDDLLAVKCMSLVRELGLEVAKDVSLVSWGDILHDTILTSVNIPLERMGQKAVDMIASNLSFEGASVRTNYFPGKLEFRGSCGHAPK
jgi:DNA-binding LacI/PurR family transcriptional regulator